MELTRLVKEDGEIFTKILRNGSASMEKISVLHIYFLHKKCKIITQLFFGKKWIYFCKMISFFKNKNQKLKFFLKALKIYSKNEHNHHRKINVFSKNFEVKASRIVESHSIRPMISHISFVLFIPTTLNHFCSHFILFFLLPYNKIFFNP